MFLCMLVALLSEIKHDDDDADDDDVGRSDSTALQNDEIWSKKLCCLWFDPVEHTAAEHVVRRFIQSNHTHGLCFAT